MTDETNREYPPDSPPLASRSRQPADEPLLLPAWSSTTIESRIAPSPPRPLKTPQPRSRWWGCGFALIAGVIVLSLLGSSLFSLAWFWRLRNERAAEVSAALEAAAGQDVETLSSVRELTANDDPGVRETNTPPPPVKRINRIVFINANRQVETSDPQGDDRRVLTSDAKSYLFPTWSPDGRYIAAIGDSIAGSGIYLLTDDGEASTPQEIHFSENEPPFYLYWSPDNGHIAYLANHLMAGLSLNMVDTDGEESERVIAVGSPMYWTWADDSEGLLVHSGLGNEDAQLVMVDDFGRPRSPTVPAPGPFQAPGISPSGRYWAFSQYRAGGTTWMVISDRVNGEEQSKRHAGAAAFNWSPARDELAYISGDGESGDSFWGHLKLVDASTGDVRLLSSDLNLAFFWSPDGKRIVTISVPAQDGFERQYEVRNPEDRRLVRYATAPEPVAAQPFQHTFQINVIDVASGEGLQLLETTLSPIFLAQFLPYFDQYAYSHQIWAPDSSAFVLPTIGDRRSEISIIDARNGRKQTLAEGAIGFWSRQ